MMRVQFENDLNDLVAFNWYHSRNSRSMQLWYRIAFVPGPIFGAVSALMLYWWSLPARIALVLGVSVVWSAVNWMYFHWWVTYSVRKLASEGKNKGVLGDHTIIINEEGLTESSEVNESRTSWRGIERIEENGDYIFIYIGAYQAHVIPKSAFASGKETREFIELARQYRSGVGA